MNKNIIYLHSDKTKCPECNDKFVVSPNTTIVDGKVYHFMRCVKCNEEYFVMLLEVAEV